MGSMAFRVQTNAAPLKQIRSRHELRPKPNFPRSNERGSIEAIAKRSPLVGGLTFPRSNERGSIEAA